jgi:hypothetical protein
MSINEWYVIPFYQHNFEDANTFYMQCTSCETKIRRPVHRLGSRMSYSKQRVTCRICGKTHTFSVQQMCLTYVFKFFPDEPMVKDMVITYSPYNVPFERDKVTINIETNPEHVQDKAVTFFTTNTELLKLLDQ